jgi:hypothetical protein
MPKNNSLKLPQMSKLTLVFKNELHLNIDLNFDHQMSLRVNDGIKNNCLKFLKHAFPLVFNEFYHKRWNLRKNNSFDVLLIGAHPELYFFPWDVFCLSEHPFNQIQACNLRTFTIKLYFNDITKLFYVNLHLIFLNLYIQFTDFKDFEYFYCSPRSLP